jgi:glycosyltransferase involved in cell wall biosynthesis
MPTDDLRALEKRHRPTVVAVWNELTPYRQHVLRRIRDEVDVRLVNVFTHSISDNSMPWKLSSENGLNTVFDERNHLSHGTYFDRRAFRLARSIAETIASEAPLFVIMHGHGDLARILILRQLHGRRVPVLHASDANALDERIITSPRSILRTSYLRWILGMMDGYLAMGVGGRTYYRQLGREDVPIFDFAYEPDYSQLVGCDPLISEAFLLRHGLEAGRRRFLYSGRLVPVKRVDLIVRAFATIADRLPDWDLVIAGQGQLCAELERLVPPTIKRRVRFVGFLQMEELRHAYLSCDALVHASMREPWGLVINEAVAAGMAVIATDIAGAALELVKHRVNGYLVQPGSFDEMCQALQFVADPSNLSDLRMNSARILGDRRIAGDPIRGFRDAVEFFSSQGRVGI